MFKKIIITFPSILVIMCGIIFLEPILISQVNDWQNSRTNTISNPATGKHHKFTKKIRRQNEQTD